MRPALLAIALLAGCADAPTSTAVRPATEASSPSGGVTVPADSTSRLPRLSAGPDGTVVLSWVEDRGGGHALRFSTWTGSGWGPAETAGSSSDWFVNWADTPGVVALGGGRMLAHALPMHPDGESVYAYDVAVWQRDGAWSEPALVHTDGVAAEHGFVSVAALEGRTASGSAGLVWLDGRHTSGGHGHGGAMTLRYAAVEADGARRDEAVLDTRTCDCCPTALVATPSGLVAAYRDRSEGEVRDVAVVRRVEGEWTEPAVPHADGWRIEGCPVNGPALDARGGTVALAWYTEAGGDARVQVSTSTDGGARWGDPVRVDGGAPLGRVDVAVLEGGGVAVVWLEGDGERAEVVVRRVGAEPRTVATVDAGRSSGVPQVVAVGDRALVAWTDGDGVRTSLVSL